MTPPRPLLVYLLDYPIHETHITLLERLIPAVRHTHRIVVVTPHVDITAAVHRLSAQFPDIEFVALAIPDHTSWLVRVRAFVAFLRDIDATCAHLWIQTWPAHTALLVALKMMRIRRIIVSLDIVPDTVPTTGLMHLLHRYITRIPHQIVVTTASAKQHLVHQYALPDARISVTPIGIDDSTYTLHALTAHPRSTYHIPATGFLLAVCAPLHSDYGIDTLIRAMTTVWQYHPATQLLIAGEGDQAAQLRGLAAHTPQPDHIHFISTPPDIAVVFASVDIVVYPARRSSMPRTLLIAMALERPVIASAIPNVQELIEANGTGLLTRPNDADALASTINRLLNDHSLRIALSMQARTRVSQRFREDTWVDALCACYRMI